MANPTFKEYQHAFFRYQCIKPVIDQIAGGVKLHSDEILPFYVYAVKHGNLPTGIAIKPLVWERIGHGTSTAFEAKCPLGEFTVFASYRGFVLQVATRIRDEFSGRHEGFKSADEAKAEAQEYVEKLIMEMLA